MISRLRAVRLTWPQFAAVAAASALATTLIIGAAMGQGSVPSAVLASLRQRVVVHSARRSAPRVPGPGVAADPASAPPAASPSSTADGSAASSSSDTGSSGTGDTGSGGGGGSGGGDGSGGGSKTPAKHTYKVRHVFIIALSTTSYRATFGHGSVASYLNGTLRRKGTLLSGYQTLGPAELPDYLAMTSGQAPNADTRADCPKYSEFSSGGKLAADGQISGHGCVYPNGALTIGDQVTASGKVWKAYIDDMGSSACVHPNSNAVDDIQLPGAGSQYDTRHNPFIYFHSLLDLGDCSNDDVALARLPTDLRSVAKTPRYSFIAPVQCDDASVLACPAGKPGGLAAEDAFLKLWVPQILASPAYKRDGALMIVFTATPPATAGSGTPSGTAGSGTPSGTAGSGTPSGTAGSTTALATAAKADQGPVRTGALILSRYATAGRTLAGTYDPYSLLRSVEDLFGYTPLVHASSAKSFVKSALPGA